MGYHKTAQGHLEETRTGTGGLSNDWIGKAVKFLSGDTWTLIGFDVLGNVVLSAACTGNDDLTVLIEDLISGAAVSIYLSDADLDAAVVAAGGFAPVAQKVAKWQFDTVVGTLTLQSAIVTSEIGGFPHTHGSIVDYDIQSITSGDQVGLGAA